MKPCYLTFQELHTDAPHGPWAFVLSLTPEPRAFAGGETLLMRPRVLNYWPGFDPSAGLEMGSLVPPACAPHACAPRVSPAAPAAPASAHAHSFLARAKRSGGCACTGRA